MHIKKGGRIAAFHLRMRQKAVERWWGEDGYAYHEQNGLLYVEVSNANNARMSVQRLLSFNVKAGIAKSVSIEPKLKEAA